MDIKDLMRTYVFINDPDIKQVTTKFGAVLIALGGLAGMAYLAAGVADTDEDPSAAAEPDEDQEETSEACMDATDLDAWRSEHPDLEQGTDYEVDVTESGLVCVTR